MKVEHNLLRNAYHAFNAHDIDAVLAVLHPDVKWANGMEGGFVEGHQAVRDYWMRQFSLIDSHVEPLSFKTDEAGHTVVEVHQVVRDLAGIVIADERVEHIFLIQNDLVRSMKIKKL